MTIEISCIHWAAVDEEDKARLPDDYKLDIIFPGETAKQPIAWKGRIIAADLTQRVSQITREFVTPQDFFWKSSKSERMHKWHWMMPVKDFPVYLVNYTLEPEA